jgi:hypothetical protein
MSERMKCPGCGTGSSSVLTAYQEDEPCPYCGLSNLAMAEILEIQKTRADTDLKATLTEEIKLRTAAQAKVRQLEYRLDQIRETLAAPDQDWMR